MSKISTSEKLDIIEVVERKSPSNSTNNNNESFGKELAATLTIEIAKVAGPAAIDIAKAASTAAIETIKAKIDDERDGKKKIVEDRRIILNREFNLLIQYIKKEEAKEEYNQERIDRWFKRIDKLKQELNEMEGKADGFTKGFINSIKEFVSSKSGNKQRE